LFDQVARRFHPTLAVAALAGAVVLWLSAAGGTRADTAGQPQGVAAAVAPTIAWGSGGGCTQSMPTADFGTLAAGASNTLTGFTGCVTSNKSWAVATRMSSPLTSADDGSTIGGSAMNVAVTTAPPGSTNACPSGTPCALAASPTTDTPVLTSAPRGQRSFSYSLTLNVPATATGGTYTNGALTFTASN
jgi:hypothetical protein